MPTKYIYSIVCRFFEQGKMLLPSSIATLEAKIFYCSPSLFASKNTIALSIVPKKLALTHVVSFRRCALCLLRAAV
jgi:hypothetical protein